jgi:Tol biopolymer transport system component
VDRLRRLAALCLISAAGAVLGTPAGASAAIPGANGAIVFQRNYDVWSVNPDGSSPQNLTNTASFLEQYPDISPDGRRIVFTASADTGPDPFPHIMVMNSDGTNRVPLTTGNDYQPQWSPDGTQIAFMRGSAGIWVMNADGTNQHSIVSSQNAELPSWSPDGTRIAFSEAVSSNYQVYTVAANGTGRQQITTGPGTNLWPDWSPDGTRIVFMSDRLCAPFCYDQIYAINVDGSNLTQLTTITAADAQSPVWSPDGTRIAFMNTGPQGGNHHLYSMNPDGSDIIALTTDESSGDANEGQPDWGPSQGQPPAITSVSSTSVGMRTPFDFHVTTSGAPTASVSESGALPAGVTFVDNGDGTADLSGSAAAGTAGTYPITITASNGVGSPAGQPFVLTVTSAPSAPAITSGASDTETFGVAFSYLVTSTGYPVPKLTKSGGLPPGVTFTDNGNGTATIAGTPAKAAIGIYALTLTAKSSAGTATVPFTLTITKAPSITKIPTTTALVGSSLSLPVTAKGFTVPTLSASGLPSGLGFADHGDGTGTISGAPPTGSGGSYTVTVTATNALGAASQSFTLKVNEAPAITSPSAATATVGSAFSFQVTATGFPIPKFSKVGTLPKGITFTAASGTLSGTPKANAAGSYPITVTAKNSSGTFTQTFTLTVQ